ncbi:MAG: ABC transporter permease [Devosia sp.]|nr:ABC transporter permease [Devosia sp.]
MESFATTHDLSVLLAILPITLIFGAAHALTPGHGKSVLAVYAVGSELPRLQVLLTAVVQAVTHIGMAVVLALVANSLITRTIVGAGQAPALELISRALLVAVGGWLILRAVVGRTHVHGEGIFAGVAAGLVPCPLTLFLMFFAASRGVPEAGITLAFGMVLGVGTVLVVVALASVLARDHVLRLMNRHGVALRNVTRVVDALAGMLLLILAMSELAG